MLSRRGFLTGSTASAVASLSAGCLNAKKGTATLDPNRVVVISDIHIPLPWSEQQYRTGREYPWIVDTVKDEVAEILALDPLPANIISLGDMSIAFGEEKEYAILRELLQPLYDRGIAVTLGMGNHDIRASFAKSFPLDAKKSLVPGRYVYRVETPQVDFIVLDSLKEPTERGSYKAVEGYGLGKAQLDWFERTLGELKKPTFVCAHHHVDQTERGLRKKVIMNPHVVGYLHGHHHHWQTDSLISGWSDNARVMRSVGIGSFGIDRDVGYAIIDMTPEVATLKIIARDYYFPVKKPQAERPPLWDELVRDHLGRKVVFPLR